MRPQDEILARELHWLREFTPATRGAADTARLAAAHLGFATTGLEEGLSSADVIFTATDRDGAVPPDALARCKNGAFLANLGHTSG